MGVVSREEVVEIAGERELEEKNLVGRNIHLS